MSSTLVGAGLAAATAPVQRRVRGYFAPVNRLTGTPTIFDPAQMGAFALNAPPAPWVDLGWCTEFTRTCGTKFGAVRTGAPLTTQGQVRTELSTTVQVNFESWGKLQMALASGSEQMNLLLTPQGATANGSGGVAAAAVPLATAGGGSTATSLQVGSAAAGLFNVGDLVAVDLDYTGQIGFVGSGVSAAYVSAARSVSNDVNYIRRVTLNVGRLVAIAGGALQLGGALLAGAPVAGMSVSRLAGFVDREGGTFFQEWSGLFCVDGEQGDRVLFHYPRLQTTRGSGEKVESLAGPLGVLKLAAAFQALPVRDGNDGQMTLCFRSYLPGPMRSV